MSDLSKAAVAVKANPTIKDLVEQQLPAIERQLGWGDELGCVRARRPVGDHEAAEAHVGGSEDGFRWGDARGPVAARDRFRARRV